jgi:hypothetical protein
MRVAPFVLFPERSGEKSHILGWKRSIVESRTVIFRVRSSAHDGRVVELGGIAATISALEKHKTEDVRMIGYTLLVLVASLASQSREKVVLCWTARRLSCHG